VFAELAKLISLWPVLLWRTLHDQSLHYCVLYVQNMSAIDDSRHLENITFPVDVVESATRVSTFAVSGDVVRWKWLTAKHLLRYGPALCVCTATVGIALSTVIWIRLQRHLPATLLYLLVAMMLEIVPVYMHCGSYTLKQVILITFCTKLHNMKYSLTAAFARCIFIFIHHKSW